MARTGRNKSDNEALNDIAYNTGASSGIARTLAISSVSADGTVAAGKKAVDFIFSSDFAGTVLGATFAGATDQVLSFVAPPGDTLAAITYTRSVGTIRISTIT